MIHLKFLSLALIAFIIGVGVGISATPKTQVVTLVHPQTDQVSTNQKCYVETTQEQYPPWDEVYSQFQNILYQTRSKVDAYNNGEISQDQYLDHIHTTKKEVIQLRENASNLKPPQNLEEAHLHLVKGLNLIDLTYNLIEEGLVQNDPKIFNEGKKTLTQAEEERDTIFSILVSMAHEKILCG